MKNTTIKWMMIVAVVASVVISCKSRNDSTLTAEMPTLDGLTTHFVARSRTMFKPTASDTVFQGHYLNQPILITLDHVILSFKDITLINLF